MTAPVFKVGDMVTYQLAGYGLPRWDGNIDRGGGGEYVTEKVVRVNQKTISTTVPNSLLTWWWHIEGHPSYKPDQWDRPGFLRHAEDKPAQPDLKTQHLCTCELSTILNVGCQCGGK